LHGVSIRPRPITRSRSVRALIGALLVLLTTGGAALADHGRDNGASTPARNANIARSAALGGGRGDLSGSGAGASRGPSDQGRGGGDQGGSGSGAGAAPSGPPPGPAAPSTPAEGRGGSPPPGSPGPAERSGRGDGARPSGHEGGHRGAHSVAPVSAPSRGSSRTSTGTPTVKAPQGRCGASDCATVAAPTVTGPATFVPLGSGSSGATAAEGTPATGTPATPAPALTVTPGVVTGPRPPPGGTSLFTTGTALGALGAAVLRIGALTTLGAPTRGVLSALSAPAPVLALAATGAAPAAAVRIAARHPQPIPQTGGSKRNDQIPSVIEHFVQVIPLPIWIALGASLALAVAGGVAALRSGRRARRQAEQIATVSVAALTDPLTGVLNRRGFTEATERELARARRYGRPFVLAYVDVRGLKAVNDTHGHLAGDAVIKEAARLLRGSARADDVVGRIGGDELALLLAEQTAAGGAVVAARINAAVAARGPAVGPGADWDLTIGLATFPEDGQTVEDLLSAADRRLYEQRGIALH
jgi:diguanylate cyclase (GGDEF)-like protein